MAGLERFNYHVADQPEVEIEGPPAVRGITVAGLEVAEAGQLSGVAGLGDELEMAELEEVEVVPPATVTDEAAARHFLSQVLEAEDTLAAREIVAPERPEVVPDLQLSRVQEQPETGSRLVRFRQTKDNVPIFGGHVVCELGTEQELVGASGEVGQVSDVSTIATVSQSEALDRLAKELGVERDQLEVVAAPELQLFPDEDDRWRLVWLVREVPVSPEGFEPDSHGHGLGASPRELEPRFNYLVDAHEGQIVFWYPAGPTLMPTFGKGEDEEGRQLSFFVQDVGNGAYEMRDTTRKIATYDHSLADISNQVVGPITDPSVNLGGKMKAAVSAHFNSGVVDDFFRGVLKRNGIDNNGMELVNVVNCTYSRDSKGGPGVWRNAVWWENRMWYGQAPDGSGQVRSYSRHLDVIAHELTHGVTASTADLVYKDQSGALNESFSDIFGIFVKNWDSTQPQTGGDVSKWDWTLGANLSASGGPLRDLSDPTVTRDPAHMDQYVNTKLDSGGVHTNSNIHNLAAHNVLTAKDANGTYVFTPYEGALLFYLGLEQLGELSNFQDSLNAVVNAANSLWKGDPPLRDAKVAAIRSAFAAVGIS